MNEEVRKIQEQYPEGTRIELIFMDDKHSPKDGAIGTVRKVDGIGQIHMVWDDKSTLPLVVGVDKFKVLELGTMNS